MEEHFNVPARIMELQEGMNMSNHELAIRCDVDDATASRWLRREVNYRIHTIEKICYAFGVTLCEFFSPGNGRERRKKGNNQRLRHLWRLADAQQQSLILFVGESIVLRGSFKKNEVELMEEIKELAEQYHREQQTIIDME